MLLANMVPVIDGLGLNEIDTSLQKRTSKDDQIAELIRVGSTPKYCS